MWARRRSAVLVLAASTAAAALSGCAARRGVRTAGTDPLADARQLVLVTTPGWSDVQGTLRRYERTGPGAPWTEVGGAAPVVVGRAGLAWGRGRNPAAGGKGPIKREGDGKSPAGIFSLGSAFGFADPGEAGIAKARYRTLTPETECVDDARSSLYNQVVERSGAPRVDWTSSEKMRGVPEYRWGVVVNHNTPASPGAGSCIFLHVQLGPPKGTSGCTAMDEDMMTSLVRWLDDTAQPRLVQLPAAEWNRLRAIWQLP